MVRNNSWSVQGGSTTIISYKIFFSQNSQNDQNNKNNQGIKTSGDLNISIIPGISKFLSITFSKPLPIDVTKDLGYYPNECCKEKIIFLTLNKVGKMQLNCHGIPPQNL